MFAVGPRNTAELLVLIILAFFGALIGGQLNRAIYRWAWDKRLISPWSATPKGAKKRTWQDCIPIVGWWFLRRESKLHGVGFWIRPMLIELGAALGLAALYQWEITGQLLPPAQRLLESQQLTGWQIHGQIFAHVVLFALMIIGTFIDFDEKTIPDEVTVTGTLVALLLCTVTMLPVLPPTTGARTAPANVDFEITQTAPLRLNYPHPWIPSLDGVQGLAIGLFCWVGWILAIIPKTIYGRRGIVKAIRYSIASAWRHPWTKWFALTGVIGAIAIVAVWYDGRPWEDLLSALVGLLCGGGLIWAIRIISGYVLGIEAMGFGDVTLMSMVGAFVGWQAVFLSMFFAIMFSAVVALVSWLITRNQHLPFGPWLCAGSAVTVIFWKDVWNRCGDTFDLGWLLLAVIAVALVLMGIVLWIIQIVKRVLGIEY